MRTIVYCYFNKTIDLWLIFAEGRKPESPWVFKLVNEDR